MLTFLRKIRKSLIDSGSTHKYLLYAIGEIALVVIGILIALQINNWNEWRKDRVAEKEVLKELQSDFVVNANLLVQEYENVQSRIHEIDNALSYVNRIIPDTLNIVKILSPFYGVAVHTFEPVQGALDEVINSGKLNLIQNHHLRRSLSSWSRTVADSKEHEKKVLKFRESEFRPYMIKCCPQWEQYQGLGKKAFSDYKFGTMLNIYNTLLNVQFTKNQPIIDLNNQILELLDLELDDSFQRR